MVKKEKGSPTRSGNLKHWSPDETASLAEALGLLFDGQKQYGKNTAQLENMVKLFAWVLKDYPIERVMFGIGEYVKRNGDIPTPSDVVKIIDPPIDPWKPDWNYAQSLRKIKQEQGPFGLDQEEADYLGKCDEYAKKSAREDQ